MTATRLDLWCLYGRLRQVPRLGRQAVDLLREFALAATPGLPLAPASAAAAGQAREAVRAVIQAARAAGLAPAEVVAVVNHTLRTDLRPGGEA